MSRNMIDVTPLAKPVNVFAWLAASLKEQRSQAKKIGQITPQIEKKLSESIGWFEHLAGKIDYDHTSPSIMMAVGALALNGEDRAAFMDALQQIDDITNKV